MVLTLVKEHLMSDPTDREPARSRGRPVDPRPRKMYSRELPVGQIYRLRKAAIERGIKETQLTELAHEIVLAIHDEAFTAWQAETGQRGPMPDAAFTGAYMVVIAPDGAVAVRRVGESEHHDA